MIDIYCDGSCLDNQTPENRRAGTGYVVVDGDERVHEASEYAGDGEDVSNNTAEYDAILAALEWREDHRPDEDATIHTDSELILNQISGEWGCNANHLFPRMVRARDMLHDGDSLETIEESHYLARAHDLAKSGARQEEPPSKTTGTKTRGSSSGRTEITEIDPIVLDETPGPVEQPHDGIVPSNIPDEMKRRVQWINWEPRKIDGRWTKIPKCPEDTDRNASSNDESTWSDFETVMDAIDDRVPGIGFVLATGDPYVALDLDDCRDPETLEIDQWALDVMHSLNSYSQVSVSNTGVHVFIKAGGVPDFWKNKKDADKEMEVYEWGRFITMTGHRVDGTPRVVVEQPHFDLWLRRMDKLVYD